MADIAYSYDYSRYTITDQYGRPIPLKDPTRCRHPARGQFVGTEFLDPKWGKHQINQLFRCPYCGLIYKKPRSVREAGRYGCVEIEDPRVFRSLRFNKDVEQRFYRG